MCSPMRDAIFQPTFFALKLLQRACQTNLSAVTMPCYVSFSLERNPQFTRLPFRDFFQTKSNTPPCLGTGDGPSF